MQGVCRLIVVEVATGLNVASSASRDKNTSVGNFPMQGGCCRLIVVVAEAAAGFNVAASTSRDKKYFL